MLSSKIKHIIAREILDSRGNPTVACRVTLMSGATAEARVPSGASTGIHEALELRDGGKRYGGKGVRKAVTNVNQKIASVLHGIDATRQADIDHVMIELDGTVNKSRLGANAILSVSLGVAQALAVHRKQPLWKSLRNTFHFSKKAGLPVPMMNLLNGGVHANFAMDVQECMVMPRQRTFAERVRAGSEIFHVLAKLLRERGFATTVGDEGGFAPKLATVEDSFALLIHAIKKAGYKPGTEVGIGTDVAASELYDKKKNVYRFKAEGRTYTASELLNRYARWQKQFPLQLLEDPYDQDDWAAWELAVPVLKKRSLIVGDDFFVTDVKRLERGIREKAATSILIKLNQVGSLTETVDAICVAQKAKFAIVISHRSGETVDTTIADLAVACGAEHIKTGSLSRSERVEKYNRLMEIETELKLK